MTQLSTCFIHLPDMEIITTSSNRRSFPRHMHDSFCIGLVEHGTRTIETQGEEHLIKPGEIYVLNSRQPHACKSNSDNTVYHVLSIKPDAMRSFIGEQPTFRPTHIVNPLLADMIRALCRLVENEHDPFEREHYIIQLLTELVSHYSDHIPNLSQNIAIQSDLMHQACDYIHSNYAEKLSLEDIARICHLSPYHFQRTFVEYIGLSPHDYLVHIRLKHSKAMLSQGMPIVDVAQNVGFTDQSHFTHSFKRIVGMTPGYFAKQTTA